MNYIRDDDIDWYSMEGPIEVRGITVKASSNGLDVDVDVIDFSDTGWMYFNPTTTPAANQPQRTEIKAMYGNSCNTTSTINLCSNETTWNVIERQCVPEDTASTPI